MFQLQDLQSDARFLLFGDSTNLQYDTTDLNRNLNRWYETALGWILAFNGEWQVNGEIAVTDIVAGQREYILPSDILSISEVYIQSNTTGAVYTKAKQRDLAGIDVYNENYHPIIPEFDLFDNSLFIYINDDTITAVPSGIKVVYQKDLVELANATDAPNISEPFKRVLSVGAASDYCVPNEMYARLEALNKDLYGDPTKPNSHGLKQDLLDYYSIRSVTKPLVIQSQQENFI